MSGILFPREEVGEEGVSSGRFDGSVSIVVVTAGDVGRLGFSASPIVLGLILGAIAERGFVQGNLIGNARGSVMAEFFARPISLGIIFFIVLGLLWPLWSNYQARKAGEAHD